MVFESIVTFAQVCQFQGYEPSVVFRGIEDSLNAGLSVDFLWRLSDQRRLWRCAAELSVQLSRRHRLGNIMNLLFFSLSSFSSCATRSIKLS